MNTHTKQQEDQVFEMDFIVSQKSDPPFAHILALSHISLLDNGEKDRLMSVSLWYSTWCSLAEWSVPT